MAVSKAVRAELRPSDEERLRRYLDDRLELDTDSPLSVRLIAGGLSNLTYRVANGDRSWVLRRQPLGDVLPTAHDMRREYRVLGALAGTCVPVPRPLLFCGDPELIGACFYVMEDVQGRVLRSADDLRGLAPEAARRAAADFVEVLASLHALDYNEIGLGDFGRPDGYLARQIARWTKQWEQSRTRELRPLEEVARRLRAACRDTRRGAVVHGDYRLDNVILDEASFRIRAVLDWEMSTLGDALSDVGFMIMYWDRHGPILRDEPLGAAVGFPDRDELAAAYHKVSGVPIDGLDFHVVLAHYKVAVIFEGIHARGLNGNMPATDAAYAGARVEAMAQRALEIADRSSLTALRARSAAG